MTYRGFSIRKLIMGILLTVTPTVFANQEVLNIGVGSEFENLNPLIGNQAVTKYMLYMAHRPLVVLTPDLKWEPRIIKEIPTLKNKLLKKKGEGLELEFMFIDNLKWGDGTPVTCADYKLSWQVGRHKNVSIPDRERFDNIANVSWSQDKPTHCKVEMKKARYDYFVNFLDLLPSHLEGPVFEKFKDKSQGYDQNSLYTKKPTHPGLYFGPYRISEVKLGSHVILTPNPRYHGKKPYFKKIVFKLIPNTSTLEANLRSKNIDLIASAAGLSLDQSVAFEKKVKAEKLAYEVLYEDGVIYAHIDMNLDNPILKDIKVRRALAHGFNKQEIINALLEGKGAVAHHFVTQNDPWYVEDVMKYEFSRRKANKLLDEAGWKMGPEGVRIKDGKKLSLTIVGAAGVKLIDMIQAYLQEQYKSLGVQLVIKNEPPRVFFGVTTNQRKFDLAMYSWISNPENSPRSTLHSMSIPTKQNSWAGQNFPGYSNPQMDKMIDELEKELDFEKRAEIAKKVVKKYAEDLPVIPVYYRPNTTVVPAGIKNYRLSGHQYYETLNVEDWTF